MAYIVSIVCESQEGVIVVENYQKNSQREISDFLGISINQVSNLLTEGKKEAGVIYHKIPKAFKNTSNSKPLIYKLMATDLEEQATKRVRKHKYTKEELRQRALINQHRYYYRDRPEHTCQKCAKPQETEL